MQVNTGFNGSHSSLDVVVEIEEEVPVVDIDSTVDVNEAVIALKLIDTPAL
jgi:hypothetical protein